MALDDLNPEEQYDRVYLGKEVKEWRLKTSGALTNLDRIFTDIEDRKIIYAQEPEILAYLDSLTAELKAAMFNIYNKY